MRNRDTPGPRLGRRYYTQNGGKRKGALPIEPVHRHLDPLAHPHLAGVGGALDHGGDGLLLLRREGREDEVGQLVSGWDAGFRRDAEAQARDLVGAQALQDRFEAAMAGGAPRSAEAQTAERQVDLVVDHQDLRRVELVPLEQTARGIAAPVHIGLRPGQPGPAVAPASDQGVALQVVDRDPPAAGELLDHPETHVVAGLAILRAGVPQAQDEAGQPQASSVLPRLITSGSARSPSPAVSSVRTWPRVTITRSGSSCSVTPCGSSRFRASRCWPTCRPVTSTSICFGMSPGRQSIVSSRVVNSSRPPSVLTPRGVPTSSRGTVTRTFWVISMRWKSRWMTIRLTGSRWRSRRMAWRSWPLSESLRRKMGFSLSAFFIRSTNDLRSSSIGSESLPEP